MQWLIDIVQEWIVAEGYIKTSFVNRGDAGAPDFVVANFTRDGAWHDLDLSGIIPAGATAAAAALFIRANVTANTIRFTPSDFAGDDNRTNIITQAAGVSIEQDITLVLNSDRKVRYKATAGNWTAIQLTIKGWWL